MKVRDLIKTLQNTLDPDEEIIVDWWDRKCFSRVWDVDGDTTTDGYPPVEQWERAVKQWEDWSRDGTNNITDEVWEWVHEALVEMMPND